MNVTCSHCNTVFRVDPAKVPAGGLRARCSICRGIFEVPGADGKAPSPAAVGASVVAPSPAAGAPSVASAPAPQAAPSPAPAPSAPRPTPSATPAAPSAPAPAAAPPTPAPQPPAPSAPTPAAQPPAAAPKPAAPPAAMSTRPPPSFGSSDPNAKARRLARALVSDIVTYHPERRDKSLADGTLRKEFMDEIKKSWEEYVDQVGPEMAKSTPHFREALNDILAKGQAVF